MITIKEIYLAGQRFIEQVLKKESYDQGHYLNGAMDDSFEAKESKTSRSYDLEGFAVDYTRYVNDGVPAASASFKQFPFLVKYFQQRGLGEDEAKGAAAATIRKWMKEGMSTQASKKFSKTGARQHFIESAFTGNDSRLDDFMGAAFDFHVEEYYHRTKSETI